MYVEIDRHDVFGHDPRAEVGGLLAHEFHQLRAAGALFGVRGHDAAAIRGDRAVEIGRHVARRKAGIVLHLGRQCQLPQRQRAGQAVLLGNRPLEEQRLQGGPGGVDGSRPTGGSAADNDYFLGHYVFS